MTEIFSKFIVKLVFYMTLYAIGLPYCIMQYNYQLDVCKHHPRTFFKLSRRNNVESIIQVNLESLLRRYVSMTTSHTTTPQRSRRCA